MIEINSDTLTVKVDISKYGIWGNWGSSRGVEREMGDI